LTGFRISDPHLSSAQTLGDLYSYLLEAAKPQPTSLYSAIHVEGQKARERAKQQAASEAATKRRADLGDLINLGNVELRRVKANKTGLDKVVNYALRERGLGNGVPSRIQEIRAKKARSVRHVRTQREFVNPLSSKAAKFLETRTQ
jgi:hypothetical protein